MDLVVKTVDVEGGVMDQVDVGHEGTSTGDFCVYPVDGVRMEVSAWEDGGDDDLGGGEGQCGFLCYSLHRLCDPLLL